MKFCTYFLGIILSVVFLSDFFLNSIPMMYDMFKQRIFYILTGKFTSSRSLLRTLMPISSCSSRLLTPLQALLKVKYTNTNTTKLFNNQHVIFSSLFKAMKLSCRSWNAASFKEFVTPFDNQGLQSKV